MLKKLFFLFSIFLFSVSTSYAFEIYSFVLGCDVKTGLIVYSNKEQFEVLTLEGRREKIALDDIDDIFIFNLLGNPFQTIHFPDSESSRVRSIRLQNDLETELIGWPIRFIKDDFIFFDIQGKSYIISKDNLYTIKKPDSLQAFVEVPNAIKIDKADFQQYSKCSKKKTTSKNNIYPTRTLRDKIRIFEFFNSYAQGFQKLDRFQDSTAFYSKPFIFDKKTKVNLHYFPNDSAHEMSNSNGFSFSLRLFSGSSYSNQTQFSLFFEEVEYLPLLEPVLMMRADAKSHFFQATFIGNIIALNAGKDYIISNRQNFGNYFEKNLKNKNLVSNNFNHLALTGGDFGAFSFSGGYYYPLIGIKGGEIYREILSTKTSPMIKIGYTVPKSSFFLIGASTQESSKKPNEENVKLLLNSELVGQGATSLASLALYDQYKSFSLDQYYIRFNAKHEMKKGITIGFSQIYLEGKYEENLSSSENSLNYNQLKTGLSIEMELLKVGLRLNLNYYKDSYDSNYFSKKRNDTIEDWSIGGTIEFYL